MTDEAQAHSTRKKATCAKGGARDRTRPSDFGGPPFRRAGKACFQISSARIALRFAPIVGRSAPAIFGTAFHAQSPRDAHSRTARPIPHLPALSLLPSFAAKVVPDHSPARSHVSPLPYRYRHGDRPAQLP